MLAVIFGALSPLFGIIGALLPSIVRVFERKQEIKYEIELSKLQLDAASATADKEFDVERIKALVAEGQSLRNHDMSVDGGDFLNALRASIRPVITYAFFTLFMTVKTAGAYIMFASGASIPETLTAVWDTETMALFSTIIAFWFGSRMFEKINDRTQSRKPN